MKPKKVLVLGSGSLKIGESGEFDYSGSQCLKALKEEGIETILVNPNIATIQTSTTLATKVYLLPITVPTVTEIIKKEKPDAIALSFGGQTALNCGVALHNKGILKKYDVSILGTPVKSIELTEDRDLFAKTLRKLGLKTPKSVAVKTLSRAIKAAEHIGFPVMMRSAYALGGLGSGVAHSMTEFETMARKALSNSPQILVEEYLGGWKEIEYEVVRDQYDNCLTVCNMENIDPMGIHTGESIVVAPSQTLNNEEYHLLRTVATTLIRHLGIVGECNIQYALDPHSTEYRIIEVNARLSRSSALASKATGYPLAHVATKLGLGYALSEVSNQMTGVTSACFEPALDYIVMKYPRWDLSKFSNVSTEIGSEMKSVGEVMAIGRSFEEVLQKALRMTGNGLHGFVANTLPAIDVDKELTHPTDKRMLAIARAFDKGYSLDKVARMTKIDRFFLAKMHGIVKLSKKIQRARLSKLSPELLRESKQKGFSDFQLARLLKGTQKNHHGALQVREKRIALEVLPVAKKIDTLGGEWEASSNFLYLTYHGTHSEHPTLKKKTALVLGSGAYRIGSSVEFDWCSVLGAQAFRKKGYQTIMINYNPETVSTDYNMGDCLYFDELTFERVLDIYQLHNPQGVVVSLGGQIPNILALRLEQSGVTLFGTTATNIDRAENRKNFSALLDHIGVNQPLWDEVTSVSRAKKFASRVGYPVLIRPSYVLSGAAMSVASSDQQLEEYLDKAAEVSKDFPVVISKYIEDGKEIEFDGVAHKGDVVIFGISEHVENAGVHSGDATLVFPPQYTYLETIRQIRQNAKKIAKQLQITGPFNIQFIAKNNDVSVIECNVRASRSLPFVSKVTGHDFVEIAVQSMLGKPPTQQYDTLGLDHVGVKAPQFSFSRLKGADPRLSVEMASTGEVGCLGESFHEALFKALLSVGYKPIRKGILISSGDMKSKTYLLPTLKKIAKQHKLYATQGTHDHLDTVPSTLVQWPNQAEKTCIDLIKNGHVDLVINIPKTLDREELSNDYQIRRAAADFQIPLITNTQVAKRFLECLLKNPKELHKIKSYAEYVT